MQPGRKTSALQGLLGRLAQAAPGLVLGLEEPRACRHVLACLAGTPAGAGLARWAWQRRPLDPELARAALTSGWTAELDTSARAVVRACTAITPPAPDSQGPASLPEAMALLGEILPGQMVAGDAEGVERNLGALQSVGLPPSLAERLRAEAVFHIHGPRAALPLLHTLDGTLWGWWRDWHLAQALLALGDPATAADLMAGVWRQAPWHLHVALALHARLRPPTPVPPAGPDTVICLYSWNKAELLARTLELLAEQQSAGTLGAARIMVLDNGSTDATPDMLVGMVERFAPGSLHLLRTPVNIGAPGARNWLLAHEPARTAARVAFLDDDVLPPAGWLDALLAHEGAHPECGAVGCRIIGPGGPQTPITLQSADYNLLPMAPRQTPEGEERVFVCENATHQLDAGLFSYDRPCVSVSGCCHLLPRRTLEAAGSFDIRFNPTQFDDLDRDLRAALAGQPSFYAGSLAVPHIGHSSLDRAQSQQSDAQASAQIGHVLGNKLKLNAKYDDEQICRLAGEGLQRLWDHFARASLDLEAALGPVSSTPEQR